MGGRGERGMSIGIAHLSIFGLKVGMDLYYKFIVYTIQPHTAVTDTIHPN